MHPDISKRAGTYLLVFSTAQTHTVQVGRLGPLQLQNGYYCYIGSAFGPGGIRARVAHHEQISNRPHWHLDYVRPHMQLRAVWYQHDVSQEHVWAELLHECLSIPLPGFGASDCTCTSHFFYSPSSPDIASYRKDWLKTRQRVDQHITYNEII